MQIKIFCQRMDLISQCVSYVIYEAQFRCKITLDPPYILSPCLLSPPYRLPRRPQPYVINKHTHTVVRGRVRRETVAFFFLDVWEG